MSRILWTQGYFPTRLVYCFVIIFSIAHPGIVRGDILDEIVANYRSRTDMHGSFVQTLSSRHSQQIRQYKGRYEYSPQSGLVWEIQDPNHGKLIVQSNGEIEVSGDLGGMRHLKRRTVGRLVMAMVSLDRKVLNRYYTVEQARTDNGFYFTLIARKGWENQAGRVVLKGERLVDEVTMELPDGRIMELSLSHDA
ncbi:MAG: hypothetical protein DHS20C01_24750 [marine bacterium B5-7]|nr:MAG: hypothetical protein DHS20C01_24750 [marine bacterium B5-7]